MKSYRDVAQLVARTAGGREVASSSLVIPTILNILIVNDKNTKNYQRTN
jgi:hypothetical protein